MFVVGVDLGGTNYAVGLVDEAGTIIRKIEGKTEVDYGAARVIENLSNSVLRISQNFNVEAVGIASPGSIDHEKGVVRFSPNFPGWHDIPLAEEISRQVGKRVYVENDANAYALGERQFGAGKGCQHLVCLTLGTGIGGGVITHGKLLRGSTGIGAELGHMTIHPDGPLCGCGARGCLESLASGTAIRKFVCEGYRRHGESVLFVSKPPEDVTVKDVFDAAKKGDRFANEIFERVVNALSVGIGSILNIFNPEIVVLGGGIAQAGDFLLDPVRERVRNHVLPSILDTYRITKSELNKEAGILGAASIVFERIRER